MTTASTTATWPAAAMTTAPEFLVDRLGALRAEAKILADRIKALESQLKETGRSEIDGSQYRVTISRSRRKKINWAAIAAKLEPSRQLVAAHTSYSDVTTLKLSAHKKVAD